MDFDKVNDPELFIKIINDRQNKKLNSYDMSLNGSLTDNIIPFTPTKKNKPNGYGKILTTTLLIIAIGITAKGLSDSKKNFEIKQEISSELAMVVKDNTFYGDYNPTKGEFTWWYDTKRIAEDILNGDKYDINLRIYGCYKNLNEYKKLDFMNEIFRNFQKLITENPNMYSDEVVASCNYSSFDKYLDSLGLSLEEYVKEMEKELKNIVKEHDDTNTLGGVPNGRS